MDVAGDVDVDGAVSAIDDLLAAMPPSPFNWDNRTHQDAVDDFYLYNVADIR